MGEFYSYMHIQTKDEGKIKKIIDKYDIKLPVCQLEVREDELENIVKELYKADNSLTLISSTSNIDVDPYAYVCIIRNGKYEAHYIDELYDESDFDNLAYGELIDNVTEWLNLVDSLLEDQDDDLEGEDDDEDEYDDVDDDDKGSCYSWQENFGELFDKIDDDKKNEILSYLFERWGLSDGDDLYVDDDKMIEKIKAVFSRDKSAKIIYLYDDNEIIERSEALKDKEKFVKVIYSDVVEREYDDVDEYIADLMKLDLKEPSWNQY